MTATVIKNVPIFPLSVVLCPQGVLSLRIFEARYLDMVSGCLKHDRPFGVSMIVKGKEIGQAAQCYQVGTLAKITNWDQAADGMLLIKVQGYQRFKIIESQVAPNQLITASVEVLDEVKKEPVPRVFLDLKNQLYEAMKNHPPSMNMFEQNCNNTDWLGYRLIEVCPLDNVLKQRLLEIDDPIDRLHTIKGLLTET